MPRIPLGAASATIMILSCGFPIAGVALSSVDSISVVNSSLDAWKESLYHAYSSYCPVDRLKSWDCKWCRKLQSWSVVGVVDNEDAATRSFVVQLGKVVQVSFRGTSNIKNWYEDLQVAWQQLPWLGAPTGVYVESGFLGAYQSQRNDVVNFAHSALATCGQDCELRVTGHSLGGSQALLFAADMKLHYNITSHVTTFGCPRVGNAAWALWWAKSVMPKEGSIRMVHNLDCIPMVPLLGPVDDLNYWHVPHEVWQTTENGTYKECDDLPVGSDPREDKTCSRQNPLTSCVLDDHTSYLGIQENLLNPCSGSESGTCIADGKCADAGWGADCCSGRSIHSALCIQNGVCGCAKAGSPAFTTSDCCSRSCSVQVPIGSACIRCA